MGGAAVGNRIRADVGRHPVSGHVAMRAVERFMGHKSKLAGHLILIITIMATIGCDGAAKRLAETTLAGQPARSFWADTVRLEYSENTGGFLSVGSDWTPNMRTAVFSVGTGLLLLMFAIAAIRGDWGAAALFGIALVIGGGIANLMDRVAHGTVIDFMNVGVGRLRTGIFNVADVAVTLGAAIVLIGSRRSNKRSRSAETG